MHTGHASVQYHAAHVCTSLLSKHCYDSKADPMPYKRIVGLEHVDKVIEMLLS